MQNTVIRLEDIPNISLYMDQVTTFFDEMLAPSKRSPADKILTKTMINNYTKDKVLPPPVKKKYTKRHMIFLILIYNLKSIFSINDIKILINILDKYDENTIENFYISFVKMQAANEGAATRLKGKNEELDMLILVLKLTIEANDRKRQAENIIDNYADKP